MTILWENIVISLIIAALFVAMIVYGIKKVVKSIRKK